MATRWSRTKRETAQPTILGLNLNKKRNTTILLIVGTILSSTLLVSQYHTIYYDHSIHPEGNSRSLGNQAFSIIRAATTSSSSDSVGAYTGNGDDLWGDSMWNLAGNTGWNPLTPDKRPITDISFNYCLSSPKIWDVCSPATTLKDDQERGKWIRVDKDLNKGIGMTFNYIYIRRLQPNSKLPVVTKVGLVSGIDIETDPMIADPTVGDWMEIGADLRVGLWPRLPAMLLEYRLNTMDQIKALNNTIAAITEIDVLYGSEVVKPLFGFERVLPMITGGSDDDKALGVGGLKGTSRAGSSIAVRKGIPVLPPTPVLTFDSVGKFKILQVADLHLSVGPGSCHDVDSAQEEKCKAVGADVYSLDWLSRSIEFTKPDCIVLSGDQLNGQGTSWSSQSAILKWAPVIWEKKIPWTVIFGNHDEEIDLSNEKQMELLKTMPYFIGEAGPESADGTGNYKRSIKSGDAHNATLFNLYFLDSHAYVKTLNPWSKKSQYDWLKPGQINWFRSQSSLVTPILRPYSPAPIVPPSSLHTTPSRDIPITPYVAIPVSEPVVLPDSGAQTEETTGEENEDGTFVPIDKVGVTSVTTGATSTVISPKLPDGPTKAKPMMAKPNAMMFFHIPLPESYTSPIDVGPTGQNLVSGERKEGPGSSKKNSGFFENAILAQGELVTLPKEGSSQIDEFWEGEFTAPTKGRPEVKIVGNGHCHLSEDCRRINGVWLCFGGGGSYSGYLKAGVERRMRVYEISQFGERVSTHHVVDNLNEPLSKVGEIILVGEDALGMEVV